MLMRFYENLEMEKDEELVAMMDKAAAGLLAVSYTHLTLPTKA